MRESRGIWNYSNFGFNSKSIFIYCYNGGGSMVGVIFVHLYVLGIVVKNDCGALFILALIAFLCCVILVFNERTRLMNLLN